MKPPRKSLAASFLALAFWADAEKLQLVGNCFETVTNSDLPLQIRHEALLDFDDVRAAGADQVMVMAVVALAEQFEPRDSIAEVEALDHCHPFEQVQ